MSKRTMLPGAFALPGLANDPQNSSVRRFTSRNRPDLVEMETRSTWKTSSNVTSTNNGGLDVNLVDENGEFWPQQVDGRLKHLTKSRPKSPARRTADYTRRRRSRSPDSTDNSFEFYTGLVCDSDTRNDIKSKQQSGLERKSRSSSNKAPNKTLSQTEHVESFVESLQTIGGNSNSSVKNRFPTDKSVVNLNDSSHVTDNNSHLGMSLRDLNSDDDLGDMLISDFVDSDDSASDDKPPLPNSPPPEVDVRDSSHSNDSTKEGPLHFEASITQDDSSKYHNLSTTEDSKNLTSDETVPGTARTSSTSVSGNRHTIPTLLGTGSQSSARRRRFKPVSIDIVEFSSESDKSSQSNSFKSDNTTMNRTFPGRISDSSSKSRKEIDWGLRPGTLQNSNLSESTVKRGTMFDQFLNRTETSSEINKVENSSQQKQVPVSRKLEDSDLSSKPVPDKQDLNTSKADADKLEDDIKQEKQERINSLHVIPDIRIELVEDKMDLNKNNTQIMPVSKGYGENGDYNNNQKTEYSEDGYNSSDDDDHDGDDESGIDGDEIESYEAVVSHDSDDEKRQKSSASHGFDEKYHNNHLELLEDIDDIDEDSLSNASSIDDEHLMGMYDNSLGSVVDTRGNTMYSPGEIPAHYHDDHHVLDSSLELYVPPKRDVRYEEDQGEDSNIEGVYGYDEGNFLQECQMFDQHYDHYNDNRHGEGDGISIEDDAYSNNEEFVHEDVVIQPPHLFNEDNDEDLFEPPAMFASSDEEEDEDFEDILPPLQLSPIQKKVMPFHKIPLGDWTEEDTLEWLQHVGLGHFKEQFKAHHVNGRTLKNINFQLLEEIGISAPDERELVLAEIYELDNPSEEEHIEAEIQDALETASEQDKEKILAVWTALRSPTLNNSMDLPVVSNESPLDSDQGYHVSSDTASVTSSVAASEDHSHKESTDITPSQSDYSDLYLRSGGMASHGPMSMKTEANESSVKPTKSKNKKKTKDKSKKKDKSNKKEKKSFSKFWDSLSISHTSSKLTKVFGSKKFNPAMQYLLQAGPQGIMRVWPTSLSGQTKYCSFMVSMTTSSAQVVRMVLEKYDVVADPLRYYLCELGLGKGGATQTLEDIDCPLTWQCRWNDPEKYRFEMRCRDEGSVRMLFEMEGYEEDWDYRSIAVSSRTPCKDVLPLIVKKYDLPGEVDDYQLMEVSEDNEDDRSVVTDHVCPLKLQKAWSEPDHVFRLVRKHVTPAAIQPQRSSSEFSNELPRTHSNTSSMKDGYETESTDHLDNTSEEADIPGINKELEEVVMEVQDSISAQQPPQVNLGRNSKEQTLSIEIHLEELQKKDVELLAKGNEIEELKKERDELLENENELLVWRMRNQELVEREEEIEKLQSSMLEKDSHEESKREEELEELRLKCLELGEKENEAKALEQKRANVVDELETSMRSKDEELHGKDREIERLYQRNSALINKEHESQNLHDKVNDLKRIQIEFENLKDVNLSSLTRQRDLEIEVKRLREENGSLRSQVHKADDAKSTLETSHANSEKIEEMRLKLDTVEREKQQLLGKSDELQRRNQLLEKGAQLLDSMRQENQMLLKKTEEIEPMKRNIIKLTSQLRESDKLRLNKGELDDLKLRLSICEAEKQQVQSRLQEIERHNKNLREDLQQVDRLKKENTTLTEKVNELQEVRRGVQSLRDEIKEGEMLREKLLKSQDVEKSLTKELKTKDGLLKQKDRKIEEMDKKIKAMTDAMKKMEAKFRDHNEQRENLTRLLTIIKDKDPSLLKTLHRSIITSKEGELKDDDNEEEEWC